ncbi:MAG: hypothetical protein KIG48_01770 [Eubacteriales bacterium]|nr:hypothetical protein [Eubacteriales bacterium]MCI6979405.1 hypothetical protein [Clostridiales bacterium]MDD6722097.1 hypothetical protein [Clostridiales bacterium]MDY5693784.1 hypothetical protein [Eubacteriales bacterium]HZK45998.1 hypothetical protein [Clostridia bacterium]
MIQVIFGETGAGKTKRIIDIANETLKTANGSIVFIDNDNQYMFGLKHDIRFVDASEFHIDSPKMFFGFISGIAAQDFDLEYIFIDGFMKIVHHPLDTLEELFKGMDEFANRCNVKLILSITGSEESAPEFLKPYIMH